MADTISPIVDNTPVDQYCLRDDVDLQVLVKREDLCAPFPGPSFSKMRGVWAHVASRPEKYIGVLDTFHSKAGWAVAYACAALGKTCVNFWPRYKADPQEGVVREQQKIAHERFGAQSVALPAGRSAILYHTAKRHMRHTFGSDGYTMPNALKLPESITENAAEARRTIQSGVLPKFGTLLISISSGTVAAGVLRGFWQEDYLHGYDVVLHMGYSRSIEATRKYIEQKAGTDLGDRVRFLDEGYGYKDQAKDLGRFTPTFPCNPHYDLKAWKWLIQSYDELTEPVVFWNIGE